MRRFISLVGICFLSGLLVAWQLRTQLTSAAQNKKDTSLIEVIHALEQENKGLEERIATLRQKLEENQKNQARFENRLTGLQQQLDELKVSAGLVPLTGPGIIITLDDNTAGAQAAKTSSPATYNPENYIIHDKNILYLVNELKAAGAEGIAVNGQRLVTTSDIRCVGTVILVNSTRLAPPYEIKAIGDPEKLEAAILRSEEFTYLKSREFPVKLTKASQIVLPAYKGALPSQYVRPAN
ncbi:Uncharacterized conserved protein YlxW, UPF0749 family [Thermanaeromonas toyohensis ToBE]|uniref:Uncharacterized conserved protein YlxW, UPF0749 family n=1 Tax=Thermanaeromonas toyohensis ToBE TaxID=698762 RepID=A0A1W1VCP1_9FIRM|nr:DUF881 domain-containing protein [Thermanaeromonas toyohensis]SMB90811.1 Uncharacterized conserved protein YlxW, UPF0749 family [Thermanaeromonas toyohensis ToBE]